MKKTFKKTISLVLAFIMIFSGMLFPETCSILFQETTANAQTATENGFRYSITIPAFALDKYAVIIKCLSDEKEVIIPSQLGGYDVHTIKDRAFSECDVEKIYIPETVERIETKSFVGCKTLEFIEVSPDNANYKNDENGILYTKTTDIVRCVPATKVLDSFSVAEGVTVIYASAFWGCNIAELNMPSTCESLGVDELFYETNIASFNVAEGNVNYTSDEEGVLYDISKTELIAYPTAKKDLSSYTVPETVSVLSANAFRNNKYLKTLIFSETLTDITDIDAFSETAIENFEVDENNQHLCSENGVLYSKDKKTLISYPTGKAKADFIIPDTVNIIGDYAFRKSSITSIDLSNVEKIGVSAFEEAVSLKVIDFPETVTEIADKAFLRCSLVHIYIPQGVAKIGAGAFGENLSLFAISVSSENEYYTNDEHGCLFNKDKTVLIQYPVAKNNTLYTLSETVETVEAYAFSKNSALKTVKCSQKLKNINDYAFFENKNLENAEFGVSLEKIGKYAFAYCEKLSEIIFPESLKTLDTGSFYACTSLKSVDLHEDIAAVNNNAFYNCSMLSDVKVYAWQSNSFWRDIFSKGEIFPDNIVLYGYKDSDIESYAQEHTLDFRYLVDYKDYYYYVKDNEAVIVGLCDESISDVIIPDTIDGYPVVEIAEKAFSKDRVSVTSVVIGDNVRVIGERAFAEERSLTNVSFGKSVEYIKEEAFYECNLTSISLPRAAKEVEANAFGKNSNMTEVKIYSMECTFGKAITEFAKPTFGNRKATIYCYRDAVAYKLYKSIYNYELLCENHYAGMTQVLTKASCYSDGEFATICPNCQEIYDTRVIEKIDHIIETVVDKPVSCENWGQTKQICVYNKDYSNMPSDFTSMYEQCDYEVFESIEPIGHTYGNWQIILEATYEYSGVERCYCNNCGHYKERRYDIEKPTYTATFVAEGKTVGTVNFEYGAKHITEPDVPKKENYIGYWDKYEIVNSDFTVYAKYDLIKSDTASEIIVDKKATYNNGVATITLSAFSETKMIEIDSQQDKALDIVLVVEQSDSMQETLNQDITKLDALKECALDFVQGIYEHGKNNELEHRIAVVGFGNSDYNNGNFQNTELLSHRSGNKLKVVDWSHLMKNPSKYYAQAFLNVEDDGEINEYVIDAVSSISAGGASAADYGLRMAKQIFAYNSIDFSERQRVVVFLTDGEPSYSGQFDENVGNAAINEAYYIKNSQNSKIFSVGITEQNSDISNNTGKFLEFVSSDYKTALSMRSDAVLSKSADGYCLSIENTSELDMIFTDIISRIVKKAVPLDKVTFVDTLPVEFSLTLSQEKELKEKIMDEYYLSADDISITKNKDGTTAIEIINLPVVNVYENGVNIGFGVTVDFDVTANGHALHKGKYKTNTSDAYVVVENTKVADFVIPEITIPEDRNLVVFTVGKDIFEIREVEIGDKITSPESNLITWVIPENAVVEGNYTVYNGRYLSDTLYAVTWIIGDEQKVEYYTSGATLNAPEVNADEGKLFTGWLPYLPDVMPERNIVLTAEFETHNHHYLSTVVGGLCTEGIVTCYECACGDSYNETAQIQAHKYVAYSGHSTELNSDTFVCEYCGDVLDEILTFQYRSTDKNKYYFDLNLFDGEINVQPDGSVTIKLPLTDELRAAMQNKNKIKFYRVDEDGKRTKYDAKIVDDAFAVVELDHFSYYVLEAGSENGEIAEDVNYGDVYCAFNGHTVSSYTVASTCIDKGYVEQICSVCSESFSVRELPLAEHIDTDNNNFCDVCEISLSQTINCDCMCHSANSFMQFLWKIINFFYRLFGQNATCGCGIAHY